MTCAKWAAFAVLAAAGAAVACPSSAQEPRREQLVAATMDADDLRKIGLAGDWGVIDVDVTSALSAERRGPATTYVVVELMNWSDGADFESAINLYPDAAAATAAYNNRRAQDVEAFGPIADAGLPGARLMRRETQERLGHEATLRWRHGRYVARVTAASASPIATASLRKAVAAINRRLDAIDAQKSPMPTLPALASHLPPATEALPAIVTYSSRSDLWTWAPENGEEKPSARLHELLSKTVGDGRLVRRVYAIGHMPGHAVSVTIIPFKSAADAAASLPRGGAYDHAAQKTETGDSWNATASKGAHGVEVICSAVDRPASNECQKLVPQLMDETLARLP